MVDKIWAALSASLYAGTQMASKSIIHVPPGGRHMEFLISVCTYAGYVYLHALLNMFQRIE